jgi:PKHD-type hydroxylase
MYVHLREVLTPVELTQIQRSLRGDVWNESDTTAGTQSAQVKNNQQACEDHPDIVDARRLVMEALGRHALFFSAALPKRVFPPLFNRYAGQHNAFGNHIDNAVRTPKAGGSWVRTDLSCTLFLCAPDDYSGGVLVVEDGLMGQAVKLAAGDAILYPATAVHRVDPVIAGERLACFFWVESMVRSPEQRQVLLSIDQSIAALRQRHGDSSETIELTGVYHNLMRQWVDLN